MHPLVLVLIFLAATGFSSSPELQPAFPATLDSAWRLLLDALPAQTPILVMYPLCSLSQKAFYLASNQSTPRMRPPPSRMSTIFRYCSSV
ncbi:hypothetical protein C8J57DRAFT_70908 [Mycena rebaudengoi]|nr:hypothetical protein C8J57DRAFT_70908 [Mycena rebaudengoi]